MISPRVIFEFPIRGDLIMHYVLIVLLLIFFSKPATAQGGPVSQAKNLFNPEISLNGIFSAAYHSKPENLQFGAHDPTDRGFNLQNLELSLGSTVDPYFRAEAHLIFGLEDGESFIEVEEAFITTLDLPHQLQLIGGQFFTRFGRFNPQHPHIWNFVDQQIINNRIFGGDALRNLGVQLSWLSPLPFYLELIGSVQNAKGETATSFLWADGEMVGGHPIGERTVNGLDDYLYMGRIKTAWTPSDTQEMIIGTSGLYGPNGSGTNTDTIILGMDFYHKWKPVMSQRGFPFTSVQAEAMWRRYEAGDITGLGLSEEIFRDYGFYGQGLWGFMERLVAGARVEYSNGNADNASDPLRDRRWRVSPSLTRYFSEFSKLRLQYNADFAEHLNDKALHAVFLQFEFLIGKHGAHSF